MTTQLDLDNPATTLADVIARVRRGEEITLSEGGKPVAKVSVVVAPPANSRDAVQGMWKGKAWMADDFTAPLPEEELREWEK